MTFSIIIPVYNVAPYLRECLDSLLAQTYVDWEAICVDDGSTDGSGAILDEYAEKEPRFKVIHQVNRGVSAARNAALDVAQGEWLVFLDGDDVIDANMLSTVAIAIRDNQRLDAVGYGHYRFCEGNRYAGFIPKDRACVDLSDSIPQFVVGWASLITCAHAFRRSKCEHIRFPAFICGEDRIYAFECLRKMRYLSTISRSFYGYRVRAGSYTSSNVVTYSGLEGELLYRVEFLKRMASIANAYELSTTDWLLPYLLDGFLENVRLSHQLSVFEAFILIRERMKAARELSCMSMFPHEVRRRLANEGTVWFVVHYFLVGYVLTRFGINIRRILNVDSVPRRLWRKFRHHGEYQLKSNEVR